MRKFGTFFRATRYIYIYIYIYIYDQQTLRQNLPTADSDYPGVDSAVVLVTNNIICILTAVLLGYVASRPVIG